jgi:hypothetical protein
MFPFNADWEPPGGWLPWLALVAIATAIYLLAGVVAVRGLDLSLRRPNRPMASAKQSA